jgi:hypothetical protein
MRKIIKLTEQQLNSVIKRSIGEQDDYPMYVAHWKSKFKKSVEILFKMGHTPEELIDEIQSIYKETIK